MTVLNHSHNVGERLVFCFTVQQYCTIHFTWCDFFKYFACSKICFLNFLIGGHMYTSPTLIFATDGSLNKAQHLHCWDNGDVDP